MNLGLNENLDWSVGIDASQIAQLANLPVELKAKVANKNELKANIVVPDYTYEIGSFEILAEGEGSSTCYWRVEQPVIQKITTVPFVLVFQVPRGCESIELEGTVWAEADMDWLAADMRDVFSELADRFKSLFKRRREDEIAKQFSVGVGEKWKLALPKK
ncbi:MAG: hypothetical protein SAK29_39095 [Scytonema sp. PMC 1069.18]|nr:hypothetical protein [Scytonema sp. PMC 1069.18]MEC4887361.1 hypothetical protein [Scytonema sp. PMC 1070.18]